MCLNYKKGVSGGVLPRADGAARAAAPGGPAPARRPGRAGDPAQPGAERPEAQPPPVLRRARMQPWQQNRAERSPLHTPRNKSCEMTEV